MVVLTLGRTRGGGGVDVTPHKRIKHQYLTFSSTCSFIPLAHFETSLVIGRCYGY